jgi:hypothetical protein
MLVTACAFLLVADDELTAFEGNGAGAIRCLGYGVRPATFFSVDVGVLSPEFVSAKIRLVLPQAVEVVAEPVASHYITLCKKTSTVLARDRTATRSLDCRI